MKHKIIKNFLRFYDLALIGLNGSYLISISFDHRTCEKEMSVSISFL